MSEKAAKQDEKRIIEVLEKHGWQKTDQGQALGTASLTHDNGKMTLGVEQEYGEQELILSLTDPDGLGQEFFVEYGDHLDKVLRVIAGFQDTVTPKNFRDKARELLGTGVEVYVQDGEDDEPKLLTPD
jgi:hypothetical protein